LLKVLIAFIHAITLNGQGTLGSDRSRVISVFLVIVVLSRVISKGFREVFYLKAKQYPGLQEKSA
jgi:hypothetical protein